MRSLNPWPVFPTNLETPVARSLSIQFILQALVDGFAILKAADPKKGADIREEVKLVYAELEKILLFSLQNPMSQKGGVLDKLSFYSEILMDFSQLKEYELAIQLEEMRRSLLLFKSKMMIWKKLPGRYPLEEIVEQVMQLYSSLSDRFCQFFSGLIPYLKEARSDENVLVYLIENRHPLNAHLGEKRVETLLQSFFPAGFDQLRAVINEGYTRRGFNQFLTSVEPLIEQIQWEVPCHAPEPH